MTHHLCQLADRCDIALNDQQADLLARYCELLWDWNSRVNLTRHTDWEKFVHRDLVDSHQLSLCLGQHETVLDVGSGGGVPGIVLAVLRPDLKVSLSESVAKKARALADIVGRLELPVPVYPERGESVVAGHRFDTLVLRGVGDMGRVLRWFTPVRHNFGRMLLVKGPKWVEERARARHVGLLKDFELRRVAEYVMPGVGGQSVILSLCPKADHWGGHRP